MKYLLTSIYFWASIGLTVLQFTIGLEFLIMYVYSTSWHFVLSIGLAIIGAIGIRQDLKHKVKKYKIQKKKITKTMIVLIIGFVYFYMLSDAVNLEVEIVMDASEFFNSEKMKGNPLVFQAQLYGIILYLPYPIFWYGKEIRDWICKRDKLIDDYEKLSRLK